MNSKDYIACNRIDIYEMHILFRYLELFIAIITILDGTHFKTMRDRIPPFKLIPTIIFCVYHHLT